MKRLLSVFGILLVLGMGFAQGTPAGTSIQNQASATYLDSANQSRSTTSNQVVTVVQQVYAFTITPDGTTSTPGQSRNALPGAQVIFAYTVTNNGNGTDAISLSTTQASSGDNFDLSSVSIVRDANCNGVVDSGEPTVSSVSLAQGAQACVLVLGTIPATRADGDTALINLEGTSSGGPTDTNNWARAVAKTAAALDITKAASPSGTVSPGVSITYTISGQNRGGSAASGVSVSGLSGTGILISDPIPVGLTVSSLPSGSAGAGSVQIVKSTDEGATWSALVAGNLPLTGADADSDSVPDVLVGMYISGSGAFFPQNASYTFSFSATVPAAAAQGTVYRNTATLRYSDGSAQTLTSNTTTNTVGSSYAVVVGPFGYPAGGASGSYASGSYTITRSGDSQSVASVYSGTTVIFKHTLRNDANTADSFNLAYSGAPAGWVCRLAQTDGTPISGAVGPFAAGATFDFELECTVPASYTSGSALNISVSATSVSDSSKSDATTDTVGAVALGYALDLAAHGNAGDGNAANDNPAPQSANPGSTLNIPFDVRNTGQVADSYNFSASVPSGWSIAYYPDANCDGAMDSPLPAPVSGSGLTNPATTKCFIAVLSVPAGAAPGSNPVSITATSTTVASVQDSISTTITVNEVRALLFDPDRAGTVTTPGTIVYTHNLVNNGNASASVSIPAFTSAYGWTYQFSTDGGATWSSSVAGLSVPAGGTPVVVQVRVIVPAGEPVGRSEAATLSATATYPSGNTASDTATDTTTVVSGELRLQKSGVSYVGNAETTVRSATAATAYPGDRIVYTINAKNIGTANLSYVRVSDPLPAYTNFVSVSASVSGVSGSVLYSTDGSTWSATAPSSLSAGGVIYVGVDTNGDSTITAADILPPSAEIVITLKVVVQ
ncbi:DUF11 domain-containing protein [Calidithermus roseus]|uniref:DUF11 domain-containing protein n=1 Tax=Calidithermus roseus TaxID=1644118 RepID=A0A399EH45_9DEIN|nr:DUF11 domain-containing protein [Calidithermus roseus]RIH82470.1 hypothetical protein Mrose_03366 [Calidithermus roseus]